MVYTPHTVLPRIDSAEGSLWKQLRPTDQAAAADDDDDDDDDDDKDGADVNYYVQKCMYKSYDTSRTSMF